MHIIGFVCLIVCANLQIKAQTLAYGNEWINHQQQYYKIPVSQEGMYKITFTDLQNAGIPITTINPQHLQLFHRGKEQAIWVNTHKPDIFAPTDYIVFYGQKNDGTQDASMYATSQDLLNKYYNLYSDTTAYFLTWNKNDKPGKRMALSDNTSPGSLPAESYHWQERLQVFGEKFAIGRQHEARDVHISEFDIAEGWTTAPISSSRDFVFEIKNLLIGGISPTIEIRFAGIVPNTVSKTRFLGGSSTASLRLLQEVSQAPENNYTLSQSLNISDLPQNGQFTLRVQQLSGKIGIAYIRLRYPQLLNMQNQNNYHFRTVTNPGNQSHLAIQNVPVNTQLFDITFPGKVSRHAYARSGNNATLVLNNTATERILHAVTGYQSIPQLKKTNFVNLSPNQYDYLIVTHSKLRQKISSSNDPVATYANYRASVQGGNYRPLVINVDLLYDQFNYGEYSPLAIKSFARFMYLNGNPRFLFLIGKGLSMQEKFQPLKPRTNPAHRAQDLVPPYGFPPSDVLFTTGLDKNLRHVPMIPTGRLSVYTGQQVINYLNKVKEQEALSGEAIWMKNFIHLSGGNNSEEQKHLRSFIDSYTALTQQSFLRANVTTLSKKTGQPLEIINIADRVNQGVGLITFFGHSSLNTTDLEIGKVSQDIEGYKNKGKYPFVLANGCQLASIFFGNDKKTLSEDWVNTLDRGCIGFLAHSYFGYSYALGDYSKIFYSLAFNNPALIGKPIGKIIQEVIRRRPENARQSATYKTVNQQMILQGDPAIRLSRGNQPDYLVTPQGISLHALDSHPITAVSDAFQVRIVVANVGITDQAATPLQVSIERTFSDGTKITYHNNKNYPPVNIQDTLTFVLRRDPQRNNSGLQSFKVHIDYLNKIPESSEQNNIATIQYSFPAQGIIPLTPSEFSIVNQPPIDFTAFSGTLTNENRRFVCEIDTTHTFNSPGKKTLFIAPKLFLNWQSQLFTGDTGKDSTVYYWRVNYADQVGNPTPASLWTDRSFTYIANSPQGWSQSKAAQFAKNNITGNLLLDQTSQSWKFKTFSNKVAVQTVGKDAVNPITQMSYDGVRLIKANDCAQNTVIVMAFKKDSFQPYLLFPNSGANPSCGRNNGIVNGAFVGLSANYYNNSQTVNLKNYIDAVPSGDYVLLISKGNVAFNTWNTALKTSLQNIGANPTILNMLQNGYPYTILGQKGGKALQEVFSRQLSGQTSDKLTLTHDFIKYTSSGEMTTPPIGPAKAWGKLSGKMLTDPQDIVSYQIIGVTLQGKEQIIYTSAKKIPQDMPLNNIINASTYPFMRLKLILKDSQNFTPAQLKHWMVTYEPLQVPEGLMDIDVIGKEQYTIQDKQEGETFDLHFAFRNISNVPFNTDSLWVRYVLSNNNKVISKDSVKIAAPKAKALTKFTRSIHTLKLIGANTLTVYVNPKIAPEIYYDNNLLNVNFQVLKDKTHPILEVSFDGRQIMDGEVVSPSPLIHIRLQDENAHKALVDASHLNILLKRCEKCDFEEIKPDSPEVTWVTKTKVTDVEYQPKDLKNGLYQLKVQGRDASDNKAGIRPYLVNFEVVNESSVTNVFPYPNPFSSKTQFVFTLRGREVPDEIKIQIMTVTGKVVREITQDELGPLHIGNNRTQYFWDGKDEYGDLLANGLYLYRVVMKINGQVVNQYKTNADKAFKNGFGKLYILR